MNMDFIKEWAKKLNIAPDTLGKQFDTAYQEMKSIFPKNTEEQLIEKSKLKVKANYKNRFTSNGQVFEGIILGSENKRDPMKGVRDKQMALYNIAVSNEKRDGDKSHIKDLVAKQVIRFEGEKVIPLWPKLKQDGNPSKTAGKDMPTPEDSMIQTIFGICTPKDKEEPKVFHLDLSGSALQENIVYGKLVSFYALSQKEQNSSVYTLKTNRINFMDSDNKFMLDGLERFGMSGLIKKFFKDYIVSWDQITNWVKTKQENPSSRPVDDKYRNLMVITDGICLYQNFVPNANNNMKITLGTTNTDSFDDESILCLLNKDMEKTIDFAQNSKVLTIGRPWVPDVDKDGNATFIFTVYGMYAHPDWKIPRVDTQPISEKDLMSDTSSTPESKSENIPTETKKDFVNTSSPEVKEENTPKTAEDPQKSTEDPW